MAKKKHRSINDYTAQQIRNNENTIELLTKLDQSLHTNEEFVTIKTVDSTGNEINAQIPTVGYFKQRLEQTIKMVNKLAGIDNSASSLQIAENSFKRIITDDLNQEPNAISELQPVSTFKADPNWIFDSFLNPKISVEIDLTGKVHSNTRNIQSRRFIIEFEKTITIDENNNEILQLTPAGQQRLQEFEENYKNQSNIDIVEFVQWLEQPGIVSEENNYIDQDFFRIEPNRLQFKGDFNVTSTEIDSINNRMWYILDSITYYDISNPNVQPKPIDLEVGDLIKINPNSSEESSATVYKVIEISTITSEYRVRFEQVFGEEPIPVRANAIAFYSDKVPKRTVKVSVGFDEYNVIFLRQLNDISNIIATDWSPGIGLYTNELRLDNEAGELFSDYYIKKVYDYGLVLEDLVEKKIPNFYGEKPNAPVLDSNNFKVVQINEHLTQTVDAERLRDLHNNKNNLTSQIKQIQSAIEKQNRKLSTETFESAADRKRLESEIIKLNSSLNNKNQSKITAVQEILANKKNLNKIPADFRVRGFWPIPDPVRQVKTKPQETVQFEVWYRRLSKSGDENPILTITDLNNSSAQNTNNINNPTNTNISIPKLTNATFSNWTKFKTDARKRVQDKNTGEWFWQIEDVADADTPNINQLDIPILPGEKIQIKVIGLSEVGWPETPIESDPSNTIEIEFPDNLSSILNEDDFILQEAQGDELKVQFEQELEAKGLNLHLSTAIRDVDIYYAHRAEAIASGFKDNNGRIINLYDKLLSMVNKIDQLQEQINRAKGILEIFVVNKGNLTKLFNGNNIQFSINLEDFVQRTQIGTIDEPQNSVNRTYKNEVIIIENYSLIIRNTASEADLGLLSYRGYGSSPGLNESNFAYSGEPDSNNPQYAPQASWIDPTTQILAQDILSNATISPSSAPRNATQQNNQWIWLQVKDIGGNYIYTGKEPVVIPTTRYEYPDLNAVLGDGENAMHQALTDPTKNYSMLSTTLSTTPQLLFDNSGDQRITIENNWKINEDATSSLGSSILQNSTKGSMGSTIHPIINGFNDIVESSAQATKFIKPGDSNAITIPISVFAKMFTGSAFSPTGGNTEFDVAIFPVGDMPEYDETTIVKSGNTIIVPVDANNVGNISQFDRLVLRGLTGDLSSANNRVLRVTDVTGNNVTLAFKAPAAYTDAPFLGAEIVQLHKRVVATSELDVYNVYSVAGVDSVVDSYCEIRTATTNPSPVVHNKKLRFYLEDENNIRPFEFQLTWNIKQYKELTASLPSAIPSTTSLATFSA
jgi:hypothetical protein